MRRQTSGFTLVEMLVVIMLVAIFALVALGAVRMALGQWGTMQHRFRAAREARFLLTTMENELRQGIPWRDAVDGYLRIGPNASPTALLRPNTTAPESAELEFTEPHPQYYLPLESVWNAEAAANFRNVRYWVRGGTQVVRQAQAHDESPLPPPEEEVLLSAPARIDGQPVYELGFLYLDDHRCQLSVRVRHAGASVSLQTRCFIVGR